MSKIDNPFFRGYQNPTIVRTLLITYENDCPPVWRPLHVSQAHLPDDEIALFPCLFGEEFAIITEGQDVPEELEAQYHTEGIVRMVVYTVVADDFDGQPVLVGDTYSEEAAREVVHRLQFETGVYSRAWEISTCHLTEASKRYLCDLADIATPTGFMFIAFRVPYSPAIGVKLIGTPWTDEHLQDIDGVTAEQLRQEHLSKGMPEDLMHILHLAANADVRILIFDANTPELDGLPIYEM
ncbi:MAG: ABC transporter substrate-binding protein [Alcaligenes sp.]